MQQNNFTMKIRVVSRMGGPALLTAAAVWFAGCGGEDASTTAAPPVRGEPIQVAEVRGEPITESAEKPIVTADTEASKAPAPDANIESMAAAQESGPSTKPVTPTAAVTAATGSASAEITVNAPTSEIPPSPMPAPAPKPEPKAIAAKTPAPEAAPVAGPVEGPAPEPKPEAVQASAAAKPASNAKPATIKSGGEEYAQVTFDQLASFEYEMPDEFGEAEPAEDNSETAEAGADITPAPKTKEKDQIPTSVRQFNNTRVALEGFMLPLKVEDSLVTEMLIMRDQSMCCFGSVPKINEWVSIRMTGKGVKPVMDEPVTIYGKLKVGEIRENGYLVGIYEMDGERLGTRIDF